VYDFCILGAVYEALPAQDAVFLQDMGLIAGKSDGLHRAMANAFIAVFTI